MIYKTRKGVVYVFDGEEGSIKEVCYRAFTDDSLLYSNIFMPFWCVS